MIASNRRSNDPDSLGGLVRSSTAWLLMLVCLGAGTLWAQSTPSRALLWLAKRDSSLAIVEPATLKVVGRVPAGPDPHEVVASPDGRLAYISKRPSSRKDGVMPRWTI